MLLFFFICLNDEVAKESELFEIFMIDDPWVRDPGWEKVSIRIQDEQPGSYFLELRNHLFAFLG